MYLVLISQEQEHKSCFELETIFRFLTIPKCAFSSDQSRTKNKNHVSNPRQSPDFSQSSVYLVLIIQEQEQESCFELETIFRFLTIKKCVFSSDQSRTRTRIMSWTWDNVQILNNQKCIWLWSVRNKNKNRVLNLRQSSDSYQSRSVYLVLISQRTGARIMSWTSDKSSDS
jgi:hypothetical protein